jgi:hypothetical protein
VARRILLLQIGDALAILGAPSNGRVGDAYSASFTGIGLIGAGEFTLVDGPAGLSISTVDDSHADLVGTPITPGPETIRLSLRDATTRRTVYADYLINIAREDALWFTGTVPSPVDAGDAIAINFTDVGIVGTASWSISGVTGVSIDATGLTSGSASVGSYTMTVTLTDSYDGATVSRSFPLEVVPPVVNYRLLETGDRRLLETGDYRILE